jgi:SAM-dependent methyltransferase
MRRVARALRGRDGDAPQSYGYDAWLAPLHDDVLAPIDAACAAGADDCVALFSGLGVDLWALLLTQEYRAYPHIRALLPSVPEPALQQRYAGLSGVPLATQSAAFYRLLRERYDGPLGDARVLDFGCGWGRLTRYLIRDVPPERLHGCDPVESILDVCRANGVPATLARSEFLPDRLPFGAPFDLAFAFSVFTHLSEAAHERCLEALHAGLRPGGTLVVTVRPPAYMPGGDPDAYRFEPHPAEPDHPQYDGTEMTFGETVVPLSYVRERWSRWFALEHVDLLLGDLHQVVLTLRRAG